MNRESRISQSAIHRGQRIYDWWSRHPKLYRATSVRSTAAKRAHAFSRLDLSDGETVLEIGCGPGVNFEHLRDAVGSTGTVVGLDFSAEMVQQATQRVHEHGWMNVHVIRADGIQAGLAPDTFDAVISPLALSAMPDVHGALESIHEALQPNGRLVVLELDLFQEGPLRVLNPLQVRIMKYVFNRQFDQDVLGELQATFERVDVETFDYGSSWIALATD
jgi:ubiquinone/menaquinone biosynthesis C-methylase UbiE